MSRDRKCQETLVDETAQGTARWWVRSAHCSGNGLTVCAIGRNLHQAVSEGKSHRQWDDKNGKMELLVKQLSKCNANEKTVHVERCGGKKDQMKKKRRLNIHQGPLPTEIHSLAD